MSTSRWYENECALEASLNKPIYKLWQFVGTQFVGEALYRGVPAMVLTPVELVHVPRGVPARVGALEQRSLVPDAREGLHPHGTWTLSVVGRAQRQAVLETCQTRVSQCKIHQKHMRSCIIANLIKAFYHYSGQRPFQTQVSQHKMHQKPLRSYIIANLIIYYCKFN